MMIMDARFSAELVTRTGKVYKFDAIECLAAYTLEKKVPAEAVHSLWVSPFDQPAAFIPAHTAIFLHSSSLGSPMGMSLSSYQSKSDAEVSQQRHAGDLLSWGEVVRLVASAWFSTATPAK